MFLVKELADECIRDECDYESLPQHITVFLREVRDIPKYQEALAEHLQDAYLWKLVSPEILYGTDTAKDAVWYTVNRVTREWADTTLTQEVTNAIEDKAGGWSPELEDISDGQGGYL